MANKNYEAGVGVAQETQGLSRYSPQMAQGNIFAAISEGNAKIAALDARSAESLAQMEQSFRENDYSKVKSSFDLLNQAKEEKTNTIKTMYNQVKIEKDKLEEQKKQTVLNYLGATIVDPTVDLEEKRQIVANAISQGGLGYDEITRIQKDLNDLEPSNKLEAGVVGEYQYYSDQERAAGRHPMSFFSFKNYKDPTSTESTGPSDKLRNEFLQREPVKQFNITSGAYNRMNSVAPTRNVDDIKNLTEPEVTAIASQYTRMLKPDIARAADSGDALADTSLTEQANGYVRRWYEGKNLDPKKVLEALNAGDKLYNGALKDVENVQGEFTDRAKSQGIQNFDLPHIVNTSSGSPVMSLREDEADKKITDYVTNNPDQKEKIASLMETSLPAFGNKPPTYAQALEYLTGKGIIK